MAGTSHLYPQDNKSDNFGICMCDGGEKSDVTKEDRKNMVLEFLVDSNLALPRTVLYRNLSYHGANFSDSSLKNYLRELRSEGYVERIDAEAFSDGQVTVSNSDPGYWVATSDGVEKVEANRQERSDDIDTGHL